MYVRDEVRSNEESSKAARATRSEQTAQVPRCSLWIARPFFATPNLRYDDRKFARKARRRPPKWMPKVASESQNRRKIDEKSTKIASWAALAAQSRFGDAPGRARERSRRARERSGEPKSRPRGDFGSAGGGRERPGTIQKSPRAGSKTLPDDPGAVPERVFCAGLRRTRPRNDFSSILHGCAEAPMCRNRSSCQRFVHFERS